MRFPKDVEGQLLTHSHTLAHIQTWNAWNSFIFSQIENERKKINQASKAAEAQVIAIKLNWWKSEPFRKEWGSKHIIKTVKLPRDTHIDGVDPQNHFSEFIIVYFQEKSRWQTHAN